MAYLDEEGLKHTWGKIKTYIGGTIDNEMSDTSENTVQNKVIKSYVDATISNMPNITTSTTDLIAGTSELANGDIYLVYE